MRNTSDPIKENSNVMNAQGGEKKVMKKILSVALSTAMAFSMFASVAFGDTAVSPQQQFDALKAKGVFTGYPDGTAGLDKEMTRAEFAKVITKLLGLKEITGVYSYNDKNYNAKNWAAPYIEAVTAAGIMEGKNVEKKIFDFNGKVTIEEMAKVLTIALDLEVPTETNNTATAWAKGYVQAAINAGLLDTSLNFQSNASRQLLVGAAYAIDQAQSIKVESYKVSEAGKVVEFKISDGETVKVTLDKALEANKETEVKFTYKDKTFTEKVTYVVTAAQKVVSATANNLKQVVVTFDGDVDADSAELESNYTIDGFKFKSATLSSDKKTVTLLLPAEQTLTSQKAYKLNVSNVKNSDKSKVFKETVQVTPVDTTLPEVSEVKGLGTKAFKVVFSEPVKASSVNTTSNFRIDGKAISGYVNFTYPSVAVITTDLSVGKHTLTVNGVEDYAGYKLLQKEVEFEVVEDTTAPEVVSAKATNLNKVEIEFNESVKSVSKAYHTSSGKTGTVTVEDNKVTVNFENDNKLSLGENTITLEGVTDYSNNSATRTTKVTPVIDTTRPEVASVTAEVYNNNHVITVEFSKAVESTDVLKTANANFTLKNEKGELVTTRGFTAAGHPVNAPKFVDGTGNKRVQITTIGELAQGKYTLEISGIRDIAAIANTMLPYSTTVDVSDIAKPKVNDAWFVQESTGNGSLKDLDIYVTFSKEMAVSGNGSAIDPNKYNYQINANGPLLPLPNNTEVTQVNAQQVRISLPAKENGYLGANDTLNLRIANVADTKDNYIAGNVVSTPVVAKDSRKIGVESAKAVSDKKIDVQFDGYLSSVSASDFGISATDATYNLKLNSVETKDGNTLAHFEITTGQSLNATASTANFVTVVAVENIQSVSPNGIRVGNVSKGLTDGIAPKLVENNNNFSVVEGAVVNGKKQYVATLTFNEELNVANNTTGFLARIGGSEATVTKVEAGNTNQVVVTFEAASTTQLTGSYVELYLNSTNATNKFVTDKSGNAADPSNVSVQKQY
ncbi:S-layer homology domain-containing protein [Paenibacillus sp. 276b]|uniref:S-layer homology domain-containing protein n=1 Tax=Paenibacillus sp. 276b TaxID=1566277 RepID=UPI00089433AC|nr:S-layer homology domain-containing protein [Paenibacillus sp. 276b]SEB17485.1 S-layer homology domain-containing protein [Paenibacillus sp. 276b]